MIELKEIFDYPLIHSVVRDPEMWDRVSEDGQSPEDFVMEKDNGIRFFGAFADGEFVGQFMVHAENKTTLQVHVQIIQEHRAKHAKSAAVEFIRHFAYQEPYHKLNTLIPIIYPQVLAYTKCCGFTAEGVNRKSYLKNGHIIDQHILGITRDEAKLWLIDK